MVSLGIIANADRETILEALTLLKRIPNFKIIFVKQSDQKLYIITDDKFQITGGMH